MKISQFFEQDHQRVESVINGFRHSLEVGVPDKAFFDQLIQGLHRHIYWEEDLLFPLVKPLADGEVIDEFCTDHALIWKNLGELEAGLSQGTPGGKLELTLNEMVEVLEAHNIDEERTIYAQADQLCDGLAADEFLGKVQGADAPSGWHCVVSWY